MRYSEFSQSELLAERAELQQKFDDFKAKGLSLNMARGKPGPEQLNLSTDILKTLLTPEDCRSEDGFDCRNYGVLEGLPECRRLFAELLGVKAENVLVGGSSSLNLMFDYISQCMTHGAGDRPWSEQGEIRFICNVPGYDRHFGICSYFGIKMLSVPLTPKGPDVEKICELVRDPGVKGMFCVPKYSNPDGVVYSDDTVRALAALRPAAKDFRVIWDNAYLVHELGGMQDRILNIFEACREFGTEDLFVEFASTSKISFPGAGVAALAASDANIAAIRRRLSFQTIGYDKLNQLRHVKFFQNAEGVRAQMKKHAALLAPKFRLVSDILKRELKSGDLASWSLPNGGYFISLNVNACSAGRVVELCREMGVVLTKAGAAYPYGVDPEDRNIRIAPSCPSLEELRQASEALCLAVRLATVESQCRLRSLT